MDVRNIFEFDNICSFNRIAQIDKTFEDEKKIIRVATNKQALN